MNQDFTVKKKQYLSEKKFLQRGSPEKKFLHKQWAKKKKFVQAENSPPPPITFLMVRPLGKLDLGINACHRTPQILR